MGNVPPIEASVRQLLGPAHQDVHVLPYRAGAEHSVWSKQCQSRWCPLNIPHSAEMATATIAPLPLPSGPWVAEVIRSVLDAIETEADLADPLDHDPLLDTAVAHCDLALLAEVAAAKATPGVAVVVVEVPELCHAE